MVISYVRSLNTDVGHFQLPLSLRSITNSNVVIQCCTDDIP